MKNSLLKKSSLLIILILLFSSFVFAEREELTAYDKLKLDFQITNDILISGDVKYVVANLSWFPRQSYRQEATISTNPRAKIDDNSLNYKWLSPKNKVSLELQSTVNTNNQYLIISEKIPYPLQLSSEYKKYLEPREIIDMNDDIEKIAYSLAFGKDDLFEVVFSVADWVTTNIKYDLNTVTAEATQKSSWVLENREGVCDEMTSLFISMLRSLGIPARFVSGISYTNVETQEPWGPHGWAEVYFPGRGWVPFDVTYGEYGYVDSTHIKLKDSLDTKDHNLEYSMLSNNGNMQAQEMKYEVRVLSKKETSYEPYEAFLRIYDSSVASNSYNLLSATIKSRVPYYTSSRFELSQTQGLEILGLRAQNLLLKPYEERTLYYVIKQTQALKLGYYVEYPLKIYVANTELASTSFKAESREDFYDLDFFREYLNNNDANKELIAINCEEKAAYRGEELVINCESQKDIGKAKLCFNNNCEYVESGDFQVSLNCDKLGLNNKAIAISNVKGQAQGLLKYECLDQAAISIKITNLTRELSYDDQGTISFILEKNSESVPENLKIRVFHNNFEQSWEQPLLDSKKGYTLSFKANMLDIKENNFKILVDYKDSLGKKFSTEKTFSIELKDLTFTQKAMIYIYEIERYLEGLLE